MFSYLFISLPLPLSSFVLWLSKWSSITGPVFIQQTASCVEVLANQHSYWCPGVLGPNPRLQLSPFPVFQIDTESLPSACLFLWKCSIGSLIHQDSFGQCLLYWAGDLFLTVPNFFYHQVCKCIFIPVKLWHKCHPYQK